MIEELKLARKTVKFTRHPLQTSYLIARVA